MNNLETNSDLNISMFNKKIPSFKVVNVPHRKKSIAKSKSSKQYTLNCEKRLGQFKNEFIDFFHKKIDEKNRDGSFENHYSNVLKQIEHD